MSRNLLDQESSPYLLLHKDNPVHWRPWGAEALAEAQATNKPIMLSIGYSACHWCHVMNHESFNDPEVAALMNEHFINIKVDREERPDVDQIYQASMNFMSTRGGWPLTAILTPSGDAFYGGTYFPTVDRRELPSFKTMLNKVIEFYRDQPEDVARVAGTTHDQLLSLWGRDLRGPLDAMPLDTAAMRIGQRYDIFFGGMLGELKFLNIPQLELLFRAYLRSGNLQLNLLVQTTLANISMGGIYDHLGGGIARYATDERWINSHFEKVLPDNAQYLEMLTLAWQHDRNPLYLARIEETAGWILRDMMVEQGFASSIDADSEGEEGKFYLWSEAEIDAALAGTFTQKFKTVYNVTAQGNHQGRNNLHRIGVASTFGLNPADEALFAKQREMLLAVRNKRVAPMRDDKVQADWNGLMIAALANAGAALRKTPWTVAAMRAFDFVEKALGDGDRLYHSWHAGKRQHIGFADDYAHMARAAMTLWETTNDTRYLERAKAWTHQLNEHFWDFQNGGYFYAADDSDPLSARARTIYDHFVPNANSVMACVCGRLYQATMEPAYRERCNALLDAFSGEVAKNYTSMASYLNNLETVSTGLQIIIVGPLTNPKTHELMSAVQGRSLPNRLLMRLDPSQQLPQGHPAHGKGMQGGQPSAYLCQRTMVSQPITNPVTLSQALQLPPRAMPQQIGEPVGRA